MPTCKLCQKRFRASDGSIIRVREAEDIHICPSCHDEIFTKGSRFTIDVMIVPVSDRSFDLAVNERKYIIPSRYAPRKKNNPKFIAFYRGGKVVAITHISRVKNITRNVPRETMLNLTKSVGSKDLWTNNQEFSVFDLGLIAALSRPITRQSAPPIQNRVYKTFRQISKARTLKDLYG